MKAVLAGAKWTYLVLIYIFALGPLLFIIGASFNRATSFPAGFEGFTFHWYGALLGHPEFMRATWTSALVALVAALIATAVSLLAGYGMRRGRKAENAALSTALSSPLLVPQIVMSLAMLQFAGMLGLGTSLIGLIAIHAVYVMPFALRLVLTGLARFDFTLEDAAASLGAGRAATWRHVTLPLLRPSIVAGFTFCFILSFVNLPLSLFLTNAHTETLPIVMFAYIESRIDPMIAAVAAIIVFIACLTTVLLERFLHIRLVD
jgi:putative spermidine/putrescine transport system permease protein